MAYGFGPSARKYEPWKSDPLFEKDAGDCVAQAGKWLGRDGFLTVPAPLQRDGEHHGCKCDACGDPPVAHEGGNERDIADQEQGNDEDMQHEVGSRLVIARVAFPLPAQQLRDPHKRPLCSSKNPRAVEIS